MCKHFFQLPSLFQCPSTDCLTAAHSSDCHGLDVFLKHQKVNTFRYTCSTACSCLRRMIDVRLWVGGLNDKQSEERNHRSVLLCLIFTFAFSYLMSQGIRTQCSSSEDDNDGGTPFHRTTQICVVYLSVLVVWTYCVYKTDTDAIYISEEICKN